MTAHTPYTPGRPPHPASRLDGVLSLAEQPEPAGPLPPNLRTAYHAMLGHCYARRNDCAAAVLVLLRLEQTCPEEIRFNPLVTSTVQLLLGHGHPAPAATGS